MDIPRLDKRLECAAAFVECGARIIDVGTDHAYLPIYLVASGRCPEALATDVNQGPIDRAKINISQYGLSDRICAKRADGLNGSESFAPDAVLILGMGGELIVRIISEADWLRRTDKKIRLVLQPMTHPEYVRRYLLDNGFCIADETVCFDGKYYVIISAEYDGGSHEYTELEALLGKANLERHTEIFLDYVSHLADIYKRKIDGLMLGNADFSAEQEMYEALLKILD